jgi:hypothetical protein
MAPNSGLSPTIRVYAAFQSDHAFVTNNVGFEITFNAKWQNATTRWQTDSFNNMACKFYMGDAGFGIKNTGSFPTNFFDDTDTATGWGKTSGLTGNVGASSNERPPTALLWKAVNAIAANQEVELKFPGPFIFNNSTITQFPRPNALHANLVPKITGVIQVNNGTVVQFEGFGLQAPVVVGPDMTIPYLYAPDHFTQMVVVSTLHFGGSPTTITLLPFTRVGDWGFTLRNSATGANVNFSSGVFRWSFAAYYEFTK